MHGLEDRAAIRAGVLRARIARSVLFPLLGRTEADLNCEASSFSRPIKGGF
jgi:hypothetical protein